MLFTNPDVRLMPPDPDEFIDMQVSVFCFSVSGFIFADIFAMENLHAIQKGLEVSLFSLGSKGLCLSHTKAGVLLTAN